MTHISLTYKDCPNCHQPGYNTDCASCWLGHTHSCQAHFETLARAQRAATEHARTMAEKYLQPWHLAELAAQRIYLGRVYGPTFLNAYDGTLAAIIDTHAMPDVAYEAALGNMDAVLKVHWTAGPLPSQWT